jgi:hypothetical protein
VDRPLRAVRLSSRITDRNQGDDPNLGAGPMFSRFYLRQMEAEQLYESLLVATAAEGTVPKDRQDDIKQRWLRQFNTAFGTDDNSEATAFKPSRRRYADEWRDGPPRDGQPAGQHAVSRSRRPEAG